VKNPKFEMLLHEMREIHERKNSDYARDDDPMSNFTFAAEVAKDFTGTDAVFATMIGIKLARLKELRGKGKTAQNESAHDSLKDLAMYAALWCAHALPFSYDDSRLWHNGGPISACMGDGEINPKDFPGLKELASILSCEDDGA
jgi:hypothetical protein